ncbi:MAG: filamentation induced by cAMP protein Fic [Actinobacteria bacterium]|nr:filamentation induced by cAMP protein Fic [Actinomycetota bacterium]
MKRVETARFGPFRFQVGVNAEAVEILLQRVDDAQARFARFPLSHVATQLEQEVLASSVFGTNSIEGGTLTEEETKRVLSLDPARVQDVERRRVVNIKAAYDLAREKAEAPGWQPDVEFIQAIHAMITEGVPHPYNAPGKIRDNPKEIITWVGDEAHGGRYKPPHYGGDVRILLGQLVEWHAELAKSEVPALIRAPLVHYYYELIHPFWDGNGRVGRVLEAAILHAAGFRYAPFAMARYYMENINQYFTLFNHCRKLDERKVDGPNTSFVAFHLEGMLACINRLHDRANFIVEILLFETQIKRDLDARDINVRQYTILTQLLAQGEPHPLDKLRQAPWYEALYVRRGDKTRQRDLHKLKEQGLVYLDAECCLWPGFMRPK